MKKIIGKTPERVLAVEQWQADLEAHRVMEHPRALTVKDLSERTNQSDTEVLRTVVPDLLKKGWKRVRVRRSNGKTVRLMNAYDPPV